MVPPGQMLVTVALLPASLNLNTVELQSGTLGRQFVFNDGEGPRRRAAMIVRERCYLSN